MAIRIKAISELCPRLILGSLTEIKELVAYLAGRTGLHRSEVRYVLDELSEAVIFFNRSGRGVRLEGLGIFTPGIGLDGKITINYRPDPSLAAALNGRDAYAGTILHRENIGRSSDELVQLWDEQHADDLVQDPVDS